MQHQWPAIAARVRFISIYALYATYSQLGTPFKTATKYMVLALPVGNKTKFEAPKPLLLVLFCNR
jgi:hypothetical protein